MTTTTHEELEKKCALQQLKLAALNELMEGVEKACDIAKAGIEKLQLQNEELTVQLANAESKCRELAVENAGLKNPDNWLSQSDYGYEASEVATQNGATENESLRAGMVAIINRIGTPVTDTFLAEVRAQGVEMMAAEADQLMNEFGDDSYKVMVTADLRRFANAFAAQLRKGAAL